MERLLLNRVHIRDIAFGPRTCVENGVLRVDCDEIRSLVLEDTRIESVDVELARPGESVRIVPVKDVIEPRAKADASGGDTFPGFFSDANYPSGVGTTVVLDGAAVVTSGPLVNFQEGLIDMSGPGAEYSVFSKKNTVVLLITPVKGLGKHEHERSVRIAGVKIARFLALSALDVPPDAVSEYPVRTLPELQAMDRALPRVAYVCQAIAEGLLHDNYLYGLNAQGALPILMSPTELMDGAVVSGNCAAPCHKHTTYHHQNNPIVEELFAQHGKSLVFMGVILEPVRTAFSEKERNGQQVLKLAKMLGAQGVVLSEDGGGNPEADLMIVTRHLERNGIKTVIVTDEYAGADGASQGLADVTPEADAVVTNGNGNQRVVLPPMERTIGIAETLDRITGGHAGSLLPDGSAAVEIAGIMGSTNELGTENLMTIAI